MAAPSNIDPPQATHPQRRSTGLTRNLPEWVPRSWQDPRALSIATGVVCAVSALYLHQNAGAATRVAEANDLGRAGRYAEAAKVAREVGTPPADLEGFRTLATALERQGLLRQASTVLATAARRDPNNYEIRVQWALILSDQGRPVAATRQIQRALVLNPKLQVPRPFSVVGGPPPTP